MTIDFDLAAKIAGPFVGGLLTKIFGDMIAKRPRLVCFYGHSGGVNLPANPETGLTVRVHHHSVLVANQGREPAKNVRIGHRTLPDFEVFPDVEYSKLSLPGGSTEIVVPILAPKEQITLSYLYFAPLTYRDINTYVKSDIGFAKVLNVLPTPQLPQWVQWTVWALVAYGAAALIYTVVASL